MELTRSVVVHEWTLRKTILYEIYTDSTNELHELGFLHLVKDENHVESYKYMRFVSTNF